MSTSRRSPRSAQVIEPARIINTNLLYAPTSGHSLGGVRAFCPPQQYTTYILYVLSHVCNICRFVPDGVLLCHYTLHASVSMCHILIWRVVTTNVSLSAATSNLSSSALLDGCARSAAPQVGTFPCAFCIMITSIRPESVYRCLQLVW